MKIKRNQLCPCNSGKKYKKCHGHHSSSFLSDSFSHVLEKNVVQEHQRKKQQGEGKPIISTKHANNRFIAIGKELHFSEKWKTMHDFLMDYVKICFGKEWWVTEVQKPKENWHTLIYWSFEVSEFSAKNYEKGKICKTKMPGIVSLYLELSYFLYLIRHNVALHEELIERMKRGGDEFRAALYEAYVASRFILSGFHVELEDESDSSTTHHEFLVTHQTTGKKFHVEAKSRKENKPHSGITNQLYKALKKDAVHERIIFIDMNLPSNTLEKVEVWVNDVKKSLDEKELNLTINGSPAPPAYVFVTNKTDIYNPNKIDNLWAFAYYGFKILDFGYGKKFDRILDAVNAKRRHSEMHELVDSMELYREIPSSFNGENPFLDEQYYHPKYCIGKTTEIIVQGESVTAMIDDVMVIDKEKKALLVCSFQERSIIVSKQLSFQEYNAYLLAPETFFGKIKVKSKGLKTPVDLFEFFYNGHKKMHKTDIIDRLNQHSDIKNLANFPFEQLLDIYCESLANEAFKKMNFS